MFGIGGWEFILIAVLALLLFGPDKLPQFARTLGRFMRDFKRYQDLMESTIRAEVFASDTEAKKDVFATGKEFRERVAGGGFKRRPIGKTEEAEVAKVAEEAEAASVESAEEIAQAEAPAEPDASSTVEPLPEPIEGEGEQGEA